MWWQRPKGVLGCVEGLGLVALRGQQERHALVVSIGLYLGVSHTRGAEREWQEAEQRTQRRVLPGRDETDGWRAPHV